MLNATCFILSMDRLHNVVVVRNQKSIIKELRATVIKPHVRFSSLAEAEDEQHSVLVTRRS